MQTTDGSPVEHDVAIADSVFTCIAAEPACRCRWYSDAAACTYAFEMVCSSPDIVRTDACEMRVVSATRMEGECSQTVEVGGERLVYPGPGHADLVPSAS
jgi:hypothetical protein